MLGFESQGVGWSVHIRIMELEGVGWSVHIRIMELEPKVSKDNWIIRL